MISDLGILILIHFISDYFFQPAKWAINKRENKKYLFYHSIQYTIPFLIAFYFMNISFFWGILIFSSHFLIDDYKLLDWWNKKIKKEPQIPERIGAVQDQILHILALVPIII